jgi:hypothetical protein
VRHKIMPDLLHFPASFSGMPLCPVVAFGGNENWVSLFEHRLILDLS